MACAFTYVRKNSHVAAHESWQQARSELEPFLKEQPKNSAVIADLALTNAGLGDKKAAVALSERAMAAKSMEKDAVDGAVSIEISRSRGGALR